MLVLREMGFEQLVGLDLSADLLQAGAAEFGCACTEDGELDVEGIRLVCSDMRSIPFENHFATVLSLFTSFGYFERDEDNMAVFDGVNRALKSGGQFLIDYLNRDQVIANLVARDERKLPGRRVVSERRLADGSRRVAKSTTVFSDSGKVREYHESVRMYTEREMVEMLRRAGLTNVRSFGSLQQEPFLPDSRRLILVCEKATKR
jgi:SAM-dependent methyltransferase